MSNMGDVANSLHDVVLATRNFGGGLAQHAPRVVWMTEPVARRLALLGYPQPVSLAAWAGKSWSINVDLAALDVVSEPGCGYRCIVATSEAIGAGYVKYWCEIVAGPFDCAEDAEAVYLAQPEAETSWLGPGVTVIRVPRWIGRHLSDRGLSGPVPLTKLGGMFWVCGMGGGWCSTDELDASIRRNPAAANITHGPFEREEDAQYAFDVMWESPE